MVEEAGFADGSRDDADTPVGRSVEALPLDARKIGWWARLGPRFADQPGRVQVRFTAPDGSQHDADVQAAAGRMVGARLSLPRAAPGAWSVVARLDGDEIDRRSLSVGPSGSGP